MSVLRRRDLRAAALALVALPAIAVAQGGAPAAAPPNGSADVPAARALPFDQVSRALVPGDWRYNSKARVNGETQDVGSRRLSLARRVGGGWLLRDEVQNPAATGIDSLYLASGDLANERRTIRARTLGGNATVTMRFTPDSIVGQVEAPGQTLPLRLSNRRGALVSDAVLFLALAKVPLAAGWSATIELLNVQSGASLPVTLRVTGSEQVTVPAGSYDAWVVRALAGQATTTFWVAKGGPVVRVLATSPQLGDAQVETVLLAR